VEQHSCNGFHLHCKLVPHRRTSGAAQLHWFLHALQVGSASPDQWSSTAALVFTYTAGRSAPPDQWSSTAALVFTCTAGSVPHRRTSFSGVVFPRSHKLFVDPEANHRQLRRLTSCTAQGTFSPEEPPQPCRSQGSAASSSSGISNAVAEGGPVERESGNWCL
jgi:hypothetical protein